MIIVSVARNLEMYERLVKNNKFNRAAGAHFCLFDNNEENIGIAARYNSFLDAFDYRQPEWLVFCHEDWEVQEAWGKKLEKLDPGCLYGVIGTAVSFKPPRCDVAIWGRIRQSRKDGSERISFGRRIFGLKEVGTFDCQCLIVHSSLVEKYHLRFDETFQFDFYAEDFCINARENFNIPSYVLPLKCQHYSFGTLGASYFVALDYAKSKWLRAREGYGNTCGYELIGKGSAEKWRFKKKFDPLAFVCGCFWQRKKRRDGSEVFKILLIPVWRRKGHA